MGWFDARKSSVQKSSSKDKALRVREGEISRKEQDLRTKEQELGIKATELRAKEQELSALQRSLQSREDEVHSRESAIQAREDKLQSREVKVQVREDSVRAREGFLAEDVANLAKDRDKLQQDLVTLQSGQKALKKDGNALNDALRSLAEKTDAYNALNDLYEQEHRILVQLSGDTVAQATLLVSVADLVFMQYDAYLLDYAVSDFFKFTYSFDIPDDEEDSSIIDESADVSQDNQPVNAVYAELMGIIKSVSEVKSADEGNNKRKNSGISKVGGGTITSLGLQVALGFRTLDNAKCENDELHDKPSNTDTPAYEEECEQLSLFTNIDASGSSNSDDLERDMSKDDSSSESSSGSGTPFLFGY